LSALTWLGHSTVVVDVDGTRVVTDPVLRSRIWHLRRDDAVGVEALGRLDAILVSHTHFDHLDLPSLERLDPRLPVLIPRGAGGLVRRRGFANVVEVEPGDEIAVADVRVRVTHADHESKRGPFAAVTPSVGYLVGSSFCVYFAGDTDVFAGMADLRPVDVALLPIWGWGPRLGPGHLDPGGAVAALRLIRPAVAVPIHWGTFRTPFAARPDGARAREFAELAAEGTGEVDVRILAIGETLQIPPRG
jgi:L-ascorbate metabolism protein UlaG (beta-lactamase superfamily)